MRYRIKPEHVGRVALWVDALQSHVTPVADRDYSEHDHVVKEHGWAFEPVGGEPRDEAREDRRGRR